MWVLVPTVLGIMLAAGDQVARTLRAIRRTRL